MSTSLAASQTVNKASTGTSVGSSGSPVSQGSIVTFSASVLAVAPGAGTSTWTVTFKDGSTMLGSKMLSSGQMTFSTSGLAAGTHANTASYGGDGNFPSYRAAEPARTTWAAPTSRAATLWASASPTPALAART
ncbi:MAG TPA: Ig-like domain-containing protein [Chloroflexota bacterium]